MSDINRRNTETAFAQLRQMDDMIRSQKITIDQLANTISMLQERMAAAEQSISVLRIAAMGRGPTVAPEREPPLGMPFPEEDNGKA